MWFLDQALTETFSKILGKKPDFYFFGLESWRLVFVPGSHGMVGTGVPRMCAWSNDTLTLMQTSDWTTGKWFPEKLRVLHFKDIKRAQCTHFIFAHFHVIEMKNGDIFRLVVNPWLYTRLHGQREGIRRFEEKLAQKPWKES